MFERWDFLLVIAALPQNLPVHNAGKNILSLVKRIHGVRVNEKNQHYTFNNSSMLQMLGKDHVLFLKKILKFKILNFKISRLSVCSLYNSESDPKIVNFYTIAISRLFNAITYNNNVTV